MFHSDAKVKLMLASRGLPFKPCGLNADWCVSAWHLSPGQPNMNSGDIYLLDTERKDDGDVELFEIVQRTYPPEDQMESVDDTDNVKVLQGPGKLESVVNRWLFKQPNTEGEANGDTAPDGGQRGV